MLMGVVALPPGGTANIRLRVLFVAPDPQRPYALLVESDTNGDDAPNRVLTGGLKT